MKVLKNKDADYNRIMQYHGLTGFKKIEIISKFEADEYLLYSRRIDDRSILRQSTNKKSQKNSFLKQERTSSMKMQEKAKVEQAEEEEDQFSHLLRASE